MSYFCSMKTWCFIIILGVVFQDDGVILYDFKKAKRLTNWYVVNDGVMGGLSKGQLSLNESGNGSFKGFVTTENNGGFSSLRYPFDSKDVSNYTHLILRLKGDGKSYQFRLKASSSERFSYIMPFQTSGDWETIKIPLQSFYPTFRGNQLDQPNFPGNTLEEIGILIGNKTNENFELEIESIALE